MRVTAPKLLAKGLKSKINRNTTQLKLILNRWNRLWKVINNRLGFFDERGKVLLYIWSWFPAHLDRGLKSLPLDYQAKMSSHPTSFGIEQFTSVTDFNIQFRSRYHHNPTDRLLSSYKIVLIDEILKAFRWSKQPWIF